MRERLRDIDRLHHIVERIDNINNFLEGKTYEDMTASPMCFHAVVYNIMVIGEAANMLTKEFRAEHPEVPWRDIVDMRNVLAHGYYVASPVFIWETYTNDLAPLRERVCEYIEELTK